jgi:hypothetical protein
MTDGLILLKKRRIRPNPALFRARLHHPPPGGRILAP